MYTKIHNSQQNSRTSHKLSIGMHVRCNEYERWYVNIKNQFCSEMTHCRMLFRQNGFSLFCYSFQSEWTNKLNCFEFDVLKCWGYILFTQNVYLDVESACGETCFKRKWVPFWNPNVFKKWFELLGGGDTFLKLVLTVFFFLQ